MTDHVTTLHQIIARAEHANERESFLCETKRSVYGRLKQYGYRTRVTLDNSYWLLSSRTNAKTFTAAAHWFDGALTIWGPIPKRPSPYLRSADVGPLVEVRLPRAVWSWALQKLGATQRVKERGPAQAIRRAYAAEQKVHGKSAVIPGTSEKSVTKSREVVDSSGGES